MTKPELLTFLIALRQRVSDARLTLMAALSSEAMSEASEILEFITQKDAFFPVCYVISDE